MWPFRTFFPCIAIFCSCNHSYTNPLIVVEKMPRCGAQICVMNRNYLHKGWMEESLLLWVLVWKAARCRRGAYHTSRRKAHQLGMDGTPTCPLLHMFWSPWKFDSVLFVQQNQKQSGQSMTICWIKKRRAKSYLALWLLFDARATRDNFGLILYSSVQG